jgi:hypothetical protein
VEKRRAGLEKKIGETLKNAFGKRRNEEGKSRMYLEPQKFRTPTESPQKHILTHHTRKHLVY